MQFNRCGESLKSGKYKCNTVIIVTHSYDNIVTFSSYGETVTILSDG